MVLLVEKLFHSIKFSSKLENHDASINAFISDVSDKLEKLLSKIDPESDSISLSWIHNSFNFLFDTNKAFAKLVVDIDYPMSQWDFPLIEEYLNYSLRLLDLLNAIKSSLNHVGEARLSFAHALSLIESSAHSMAEHLKSVEFKILDINLKLEEDVKGRDISGKELIINRALMEMKRNSYLVFGIMFSCLSGDIKPYLKLKNLETSSNCFEGFNEKKAVLRELKEVNEAKARVIEAVAIGKTSESVDEDVKKLEKKLEEMQKQVDDIGIKADCLFSEILAGRTELLDIIRHRKH